MTVLLFCALTLLGVGALVLYLGRPRVVRFDAASRLPPIDHDATERLPVWMCLSQLYLDTELDAGDLTGIGNSLARSPYSLPQLERILYCEVHPFLIVNLLSVAGAWAGFDEELIRTSLTEAARRRGEHPRAWKLAWSAWMIDDEWHKVRAAIIAARV